MKIRIIYQLKSDEAVKKYFMWLFACSMYFGFLLGLTYIASAIQNVDLYTNKQSILFIWGIVCIGFTANTLFIKSPYLCIILQHFVFVIFGLSGLVLGYYCVFVFGYTTIHSDLIFAFVFSAVIVIGFIEARYVDLNKFKNKIRHAGGLKKHGENLVYFRGYHGDLIFINQTTQERLPFLWYFDKCFMAALAIFLPSAGIIAYTSVDNLWGVNEQWIFCFVIGGGGILTRAIWTNTVLLWRMVSEIKTGKITV